MNLCTFIHFFCFFIYLQLAISVFIKNTKSLLNRVGSVLISCFGIWAFGLIFIHNQYSSKNTAMLFINIAAFGWIGFSSLTLWFYLIFTDKKNILLKKLFYLANFCPPLFFIYIQWKYDALVENLLMESYGWRVIWSSSIWAYLFYFYYLFVMGIGLYLLVDFWKKTESPIKKKHSMIIFITTIIVLILGTITDVHLPQLRIHFIPEMGNIIALIWALGLTFAIAKYNLFTITPAMAAANIISTMNDCLILLDPKGTILTVNEKCSDLLGYFKHQLEGKPLDILFDEKDIKRNQVNEIIKGEIIKDLDSMVKTINGDRVLVSLSTSFLKDETGDVVGIVCIARDITERKRMEEELQKVEKLESIGILAGGIAHDFNNLLTAIIGNISLAGIYERSGKNVFEALKEADKASQQARNLAQQLLTFSKGEALEKKTSSILELLQDTVGFTLRGSNVGYELSLPDDLWLVEIDVGQIEQVINNLIINADQAMPQGGLIKVYAENEVIGPEYGLPIREGKYIKISVKDQGIGIQEKYLHKIFDPYFSTKSKGSGLSLATTFSIIKKHGGHITVESKIGSGTTFSIYLPASEKEIFTVRKIEEKRPLYGKGKILFMDDQEDIRNMVGQILIYLGYRVTFARDGAEAIELYKKEYEKGQPFDTVILDLTVPGGMGGKEAVQKLCIIDPNVKAIVSSGYSNDPMMSEYKQYGFSGVIAKPYKIEELSEELYKVITREGLKKEQ